MLRHRARRRRRAASFTTVAIPHGKTAADIHPEIDAATKTRIVDATAKALDAAYVYPALAKQMGQSIRKHLANGDDDAITTGPDLAVALTAQLDEVSHDRHVRLEWQPQAPPLDSRDLPPEDEARMKQEFEKMNCGFMKTERLDGNLGYIKLDVFGPVKICGARASAAFAALGEVDAVIFDLRDNGGGFPDMITYVESYLFVKRTHIYDMYDRLENKATPIWTNPDRQEAPDAARVRAHVYARSRVGRPSRTISRPRSAPRSSVRSQAAEPTRRARFHSTNTSCSWCHPRARSTR